ncbi:hypothetical protein [Marivirga lumbricoides]|jgi:queuine/archaeosine tRNA-ribosyltransferase|uniref:Uncharacterized protein n=1 Tax=Marivirga lumbricoides TaxID=1046115 RepID=A0A2T4DEW2_9BACT|nr:hypothetical protein C9994_14120 [Marivirga lumbricoides]
MAVRNHIGQNHQDVQLTLRWVLADNLIKCLPKQVDQSKLFGFVQGGHQYFSRRELLSVIEKHLTEK